MKSDLKIALDGCMIIDQIARWFVFGLNSHGRYIIGGEAGSSSLKDLDTLFEARLYHATILNERFLRQLTGESHP